VVYLASALNSTPNLFLADADNPGSAVQLNPTLAAGAVIDDFKVAPDQTRVFYVADQDVAGRSELYSVAFSTPGTAERMNPPMPTEADVAVFVLSPDGARLAYAADQDTNGVFELYVVSVANPGSSQRLNPTLVSGGGVTTGFSFSPDSASVLYAAEQDVAGQAELYLVNVAAPGISAKVNSPFPSFTGLRTGAKFSPDGNWILYAADQDVDDVSELYVVATTNPGASTKVNPPFTGDSDVCRWDFSPDSLSIAYCADQDTVDTIELYLVPLGGVASKVNAPIVAGGEVSPGFKFSSDSSFLMYSADQDTLGIHELYRVEVHAPGVSQKISGPTISLGDVFDFRIRPDDMAVVYRADQDTNTILELYQVELDAPEVATKVHPALAGADTFPYDYSADGSRIVYIANQNGTDTTDLYQVEVGSLGTSARVNSALSSGGAVHDYRIEN
jgi:Tol biopolymer transport system component